MSSPMLNGTASASKGSFLRNGWYVAALSRDVGRDPKSVRICGEPVLLYRTEAGQAVALLDRCPHRLVPLSMGHVNGDAIQCAYHGITFDGTGRCVHIPGDARTGERLPRQFDVRAFPVREHGGLVWLWPGTPEQAEGTPLPPFTEYLDQPGWDTLHGHIHTQADVSLIIDNLLDLSHEAWLHPHTIGNAAVGETPVKTTISEQTVEVERRMPDCLPPAMFKSVAGFTGNINRYQRVVFTPPSTVCIVVSATPVEGTSGQSLAWYVQHLLTPLDDGSTHYFFSLSRNFALGDEQVSELLTQGSYRTIGEDKAMLEAQQKALADVPLERRWLHTAFDGAPNAGRKIVDALRKAEAAGTA